MPQREPQPCREALRSYAAPPPCPTPVQVPTIQAVIRSTLATGAPPPPPPQQQQQPFSAAADMGGGGGGVAAGLRKRHRAGY
jgi:hypothetical protein